MIKKNNETWETVINKCRLQMCLCKQRYLSRLRVFVEKKGKNAVYLFSSSSPLNGCEVFLTHCRQTIGIVFCFFF